jgi:hypothetical protein
MSSTLRALLLIICLSVCAEAQTRTLALYAGPAHGLDADSSFMMRAELQRLLDPAGLEVAWKNSSDHHVGDDFELVAVGSFEGSCSAVQPVLTPVSAAAAVVSLADTSISDGRVLPFFHVDCTRLLRMLGSGTDKARLGRALARVIAHELYHIVAGTAEHHDTGVAKASFTVRDLVTPRFDFDMSSLDQMKPPQTKPLSIAQTGDSGDSDSSGR